jgi:steroid 5-alpha reductase family enzyme
MAITSAFLHPAMDASQHFIPALKSFWPTFQQHFAKHGGYLSLTAIKLYYARVDPLHTAICLCTFFSVLVYAGQQITGNASQVDRLWTFLPLIYTAHFTFQKTIAGLIDPPKLVAGLIPGAAKGTTADILPRLAVITLCQTMWSARLTFHAIRRGFFNFKEEDYRWPYLRARIPRWQYEITALFFIAIAQNILLALTALPSYMILTASWHRINKPASAPTELTVWDGVLLLVTFANLSLEMLSDQQQWVYQNYKRGKDSKERPLPPAKLKTYKNDADVKRGFLTSGLWAYSRHPNFFFEQLNWWIFWAYVLVTFAPRNVSIADLPWNQLVLNYSTWGPVLMNLLFLSSTPFTEMITGEKYPEYKSYQKRVAMFLPFETTLRGLYYRFIASAETRQRVESEVWGDSPLRKSS